MKRIYTFIFALSLGCVSIVSHADNMSLRLYKVLRSGTHSNNVKGSNRIQISACLTPAFEESDLKDMEAEIVFRYGNAALISLPKNNVGHLTQIPGIKYLDLPRQSNPTLDVARNVTKVDDVHSPDPSSGISPYTGKGVIVGIIDTGIDPTHPAFYDATGTIYRVKLYASTESSNESESKQTEAIILTDPDEIRAFDFDTSANGHGTHTSSTAAGSSYMSDIYSGIAPDADIAMVSVGNHIYDDELIKGIEILSDYAESQDKPLVVNFSIGSTTGPHDGTGLVQLAMEEANRRGIIPVFASGNDGIKPVSFHRDFAINPSPISMVLANAKNNNYPPADIYAQVWSRDNTGFKCKITVIDFFEKRVVAESPVFSSGDFADEPITLVSDNPQFTPLVQGWEKYFPGLLQIAMGTDTRNNRFYLEIGGETDEDYKNLTYCFGLVIIPDEAPAEVNAYSSSSTTLFSKHGLPEYTYGDSDESISDFCTSPAVISVGMWNARPEWTDIDGTVHTMSTYHGTVNRVNRNSSYGSIAGLGEQLLPHVVAPGTLLLAAVNSKIDYANSTVTKSANFNGKEYKWGESTGSSMAAPVATGTIALWLEADPTLNRDDVLDIIRHTSEMRPEFLEKPQNAGSGNINAYNGIKYILSNTQVGIMHPDADNIVMKYLPGNMIECTIPSVTPGTNVDIYSMSGIKMHTQQIDTHTFHVNLSTLPKGIYTLSVTNPNTNIHQKFAVK